MKCCFIHINYNNSLLTIKCIQSILQFGIEDIRIIIVDNDSNINEKQILVEYLSQFRSNVLYVIYLDQNIGYFSGINKGLEFISKENYDYVIVGNNDLEFNKDFWEILNKKQIDGNIFAISPDIINTEGIHQNPNFINPVSKIRKIMWKFLYSHYFVAKVMFFISELLNFNRSAQSKIGYDKESIIYSGFGACYILTSSFFKFFSSLDSPVFLMGEEIIFTNQIHKQGGKIMYCPDLKILHQDHSTFKQMPSRFSYESHKKSYEIYRHYL